MIELAIKARITAIRVTTDDPVNAESVLQSIAPEIKHLKGKITQNVIYQSHTFWTSEETLDQHGYELLKDGGKVLVLVNTKPTPLAFEAGVLLPTQKQINQLVGGYTTSPEVPGLFKGMSLKAIEDLLLLTSTKYGDLTLKNIRSMRVSLGQPIQGLAPIETSLGYYEPMKIVQDWVEINAPYFLGVDAPHFLVPRGLMFYGPPGTGKTMAARAIAAHLGVPLYRLDMGATLNRYIGESEARLANSLSLLERESPCVVLIDEVEKVFVTGSDSGVIDRMLSQLLWWLQEHRSKILTIMTSNDMSKVPPELFRPGRIDREFEVTLMPYAEAQLFAKRLLKAIMPKNPSLKDLQRVEFSDIPGGKGWSHASVSALVYERVKTHKLISP